MTTRRKYRRKPDQSVIAVKIDLDTPGLEYRKWGGVQRAKPGDWLVDNDGDIYTVDAEVFTETYKRVSPGNYVKITPVWAEVAAGAGAIKTKEGESHYEAGDYIVYNKENGDDGYCMSEAKFNAMYESDP
jgi:hypothetical protein